VDRGIGAPKQTTECEVRRIAGSFQEFLSRLVAGKTVLDVGRAVHSASMEASESWLHKHLARSARMVLGLDNLTAEVGELRCRGYDVISGDAITASLDQTFTSWSPVRSSSTSILPGRPLRTWPGI
jgi:hypothetical protein